MFKTIVTTAAAIGLLAAPVPSQAEDDGEVSFDSAMQCSALFTYIAAIEEGGDDTEDMLDLSTRWLVVAMARDGTEDGSVAQESLEPLVDQLIDEVAAMDASDAEQFLLDGIEFCEGQHELIAQEIDTIETD